jgi:hypothetical protein
MRDSIPCKYIINKTADDLHLLAEPDFVEETEGVRGAVDMMRMSHLWRSVDLIIISTLQ